jgi:ABC-type branched-subunit amino acid transport system substrate-binding protein
VGVIVSQTGSSVLRSYADLVLQGARVGAEAAAVGRPVELVVVDDGGSAAGAVRALEQLESAGIRAIVGPLVESTLAAAARARSRTELVLISPTAVSEPDAPNVYALNVVDTRGSAALGAYARRYVRVGVLHSRSAEGSRQAQAFSAAYAGSGRTLTAAPYDSGATNLANQLSRLRQARVQAIYVPGNDRELQVALPQVDYFGLREVQLLGNEAWVSDAARGLPPRVLEGAIVATPLLRESDDLAWGEFVGRYEAAYRRSLPNPIPALGYDAARLAARAATRGLSGLDDFRGATGVLSLTGDSVTRRPFLVRIQAGRLIPVASPSGGAQP